MLLHPLYGLIHFISTIIVCGIYYNIPCVVQKRGSENSTNVCKLTQLVSDETKLFISEVHTLHTASYSW